MAMFTDQEDTLIDYLEERYGCHTIILYGSRAIGYATEKSDWDILGLYEGGDVDWCHQKVKDLGEINAYLYPSSMVPFDLQNLSPLYQPLHYFVRLRFGRVLIEEAGFGTTIVQRAKQLFDRGPGIMPANMRDNIRHQYDDYWMPRISDLTLDDTERQFHRARMLHNALDHYFACRNQWWGKSARDAFNYMKDHDPTAYHYFQAALKPDATISALQSLTDYVLQREHGMVTK